MDQLRMVDEANISIYVHNNLINCLNPIGEFAQALATIPMAIDGISGCLLIGGLVLGASSSFEFDNTAFCCFLAIHVMKALASRRNCNDETILAKPNWGEGPDLNAR